MGIITITQTKFIFSSIAIDSNIDMKILERQTKTESESEKESER